MMTDLQRAIDICWAQKEESDFHHSVLMFYLKRGYLTEKQIDAVLSSGYARLGDYVDDYEDPHEWFWDG